MVSVKMIKNKWPVKNIFTQSAALRNARSVVACTDLDVSLLAILRLLTAAISVPGWGVCAIGSPKETQSLLSTQGLCMYLPFVFWGNRPSSCDIVDLGLQTAVCPRHWWSHACWLAPSLLLSQEWLSKSPLTWVTTYMWLAVMRGHLLWDWECFS